MISAEPRNLGDVRWFTAWALVLGFLPSENIDRLDVEIAGIQ